MAYMRDKNGRRLDSIAVLSDVEQKAAFGPAAVAASPEVKATAGSATRGMWAYNTVQKLDEATGDVHLLMLGDSTLLGLTPWPNKVGAALVASRPKLGLVTHRFDGVTTEDWEAPVQVSTGTSGFNLHVWNGAYSGRVAMYYLGRLWTKLVTSIPADAVIFSQAFNMPGTARRMRGQFIAATESVRAALPDADFAVVAENAAGTTALNDPQRIKIREVRKVAAERGYGLIDIFDLFSSQPGGVPASWLQAADNYHPTTDDGTTAIAGEVARHFVGAADATSRPMPAPSLLIEAGNLLPAGQLRDWDGTGIPPGWNATVGGAVYAKDTTNFESKGYALQISSTGPTAYGSLDVPAEYLPNLKGKTWAVTVRLRVPTGQQDLVGSIGVDFGGDGSNTVQTANVDGQGGFRFETYIVDVPTSATRVRIRIYAATSAATSGGTVTVDRLTFTPGTLPRDTVRAPAVVVVTQALVNQRVANFDTAVLRPTDTDGPVANERWFYRVPPGFGGTISKLRAYVTTQSGNIALQVFANTGTGDQAQPTGTPVASSGIVPCPVAGPADLALGATVTVNSGDWLALWADNGTVKFRSGLTGRAVGASAGALGAGRQYSQAAVTDVATAPASLIPSQGVSVPIIGLT